MSAKYLNCKIELLADFSDQCGECPIWDFDAKVLYWTDLAGCRFYQYDWKSGGSQILHERLQIRGFRRNSNGGFVIANEQGVWHWNGRNEPMLIAAKVDGFACRMNDCVCDARGRLLAGSNFYNPHQSYEPGKLFVFDNDGTGTIIDDGFHLANGLAFSPDYKQLYFADSVQRTIYTYDYDLAHGCIKNRRVLVQVPSDEGIPDGLTVDAEGFLWSAQWYGACIVRYDPDGAVERRITSPAKQTSSLTFGGPGLDEIYITSASVSETIPVTPVGYDPDHGYIGGGLFRVRPSIQGRAEAKANIR